MGALPPSFPPANPPPRPDLGSGEGPGVREHPESGHPPERDQVQESAQVPVSEQEQVSEHSAGRTWRLPWSARAPRRSIDKYEVQPPAAGNLRFHTGAIEPVEAGGTELTRATTTPAVVPARARAQVSNRLAERLEEQRRARSRARKLRVGIIAGGIGVALLAMWVITLSPFLALDTGDVTVVGTSALVDDAEVREAAEPFAGVPLVRVDTGAIEAALDENVAIKSAQVVRTWPTGLHITVHTRTPVAATQAGEAYAVLDGDGVTLQEVEQAPGNLPLLNVPLDTDATAGAIAAVLEVMDALPTELLEQVETAGAEGPDEVFFTLDTGARVVWGNVEDSELKAAVLATLLEVPAKVYNVASPLSPITT